ncbi:MAG: NAD(P)H-hydrate dehydratase [Candidatus Omnitrophica bacterium]|nr:NAD(P)H-hydrate dehydratase [Candidatus Omnitrophota bacterium]
MTSSSFRDRQAEKSRSLIPPLFLSRRPDTHKGDYGHVLVVAGSIGLTGAPVLCAQAALRAGAGLVTLAVPESVYFIVASQSTEVMVHPLPESPTGTLSPHSVERLASLLLKADVLALGPGVSREPSAVKAVQHLVETVDLPIVLDADGIGAFAGAARKKLGRAKGSLVITPHPGEMAELLGVTVQTVQRDRLEIARKVAKELKVTVVLKGHRTVVASPAGKTVVNKTGNPGMATAGTGDLLTGMIAALIAQGLDPFSAAEAGVYLHGLAGDLAAAKVGQVGLIASDVLDSIPAAFHRAAKR